jgi:hypothetical protein
MVPGDAAAVKKQPQPVVLPVAKAVADALDLFHECVETPRVL